MVSHNLCQNSKEACMSSFFDEETKSQGSESRGHDYQTQSHLTTVLLHDLRKNILLVGLRERKQEKECEQARLALR